VRAWTWQFAYHTQTIYASTFCSLLRLQNGSHNKKRHILLCLCLPCLLSHQVGPSVCTCRTLKMLISCNMLNIKIDARASCGLRICSWPYLFGLQGCLLLGQNRWLLLLPWNWMGAFVWCLMQVSCLALTTVFFKRGYLTKSGHNPF